MIFLYDNLIATMIGAAVLLIVLSSMQRVTEIQIEQTATYMVKTQANEFATWVEEDLLDVHAYVASEEDRTIPFEFNNKKDNDDGQTTRFCFRKDTAESQGANEEMSLNIVRLRLREAGSRIIQGNEMPVYYVERTRREIDPDETDNWRSYCRDDDSSHWTHDGTSTDLISYFRIDLLDRDAQPIPVNDNDDPNAYDTNDEADREALFNITRNTRIRFAMVTPYETDRQTLREVYYGATLILEL